MAGAQAVAKAFPEYPTTIVKVPSPCTHLKDCVSMCGPEVMAVSKTKHAQALFNVSTVSTFYVDDLRSEIFLLGGCRPMV